MPRKPTVQRSMRTTTATCLCVDTNTKKTLELECELARSYKTDKQLIATINDLKLLGDNIRAVTVLEKTTKYTTYGMTEQEFLKHASVMPYSKDEEHQDEN